MKETRYFFVPDAENQTELPIDEAMHAMRVLRLKSGDELFLMDGQGCYFRAKVTVAATHHCYYEIIEKLPQELWSVLSCPTQGIRYDQRTVDLVDADGDKRVRAPEIVDAIRYFDKRVRTFKGLHADSPVLPLSDIREDTDEGKALLATAKDVLATLGKEGAAEITLDEALAHGAQFAQQRFNGDGVFPPECAENEEVAAVMRDIIACEGAVKDRSGKDGVDKAKTDAFYASLAAYAAWKDKASADASILPLGDDTAAAAAALDAVREKVEDFFPRCRVAAFDARALASLNRTEAEYAARTGAAPDAAQQPAATEAPATLPPVMEPPTFIT